MEVVEPLVLVWKLWMCIDRALLRSFWDKQRRSHPQAELRGLCCPDRKRFRGVQQGTSQGLCNITTYSVMLSCCVSGPFSVSEHTGPAFRWTGSNHDDKVYLVLWNLSRSSDFLQHFKTIPRFQEATVSIRNRGLDSWSNKILSSCSLDLPLSQTICYVFQVKVEIKSHIKTLSAVGCYMLDPVTGLAVFCGLVLLQQWKLSEVFKQETASQQLWNTETEVFLLFRRHLDTDTFLCPALWWLWGNKDLFLDCTNLLHHRQKTSGVWRLWAGYRWTAVTCWPSWRPIVLWDLLSCKVPV